MILYTAPFCPKCELAAEYLKKKGCNFTIEYDTVKALALGIKVVPCLITDSGYRYGLKEIISVCKGEGRFE